jgi:hypothetical protein
VKTLHLVECFAAQLASKKNMASLGCSTLLCVNKALLDLVLELPLLERLPLQKFSLQITSSQHLTRYLRAGGYSFARHMKQYLKHFDRYVMKLPNTGTEVEEYMIVDL